MILVDLVIFLVNLVILITWAILVNLIIWCFFVILHYNYLADSDESVGSSESGDLGESGE